MANGTWRGNGGEEPQCWVLIHSGGWIGCFGWRCISEPHVRGSFATQRKKKTIRKITSWHPEYWCRNRRTNRSCRMKHFDYRLLHYQRHFLDSRSRNIVNGSNEKPGKCRVSSASMAKNHSVRAEEQAHRLVSKRIGQLTYTL